MIFAAAAAGRAAAAAGISYLFHDDDDDHGKQKSNVTISSTLVDQHGIVKAVIYPRIPLNPCPLIFHPCLLRPDQGTVSSIEKCRSNRCLIPGRSHQQRPYPSVQRKRALLFFWSVPLKARLVRICSPPAVRVENRNRFERRPIRISIGIQNVSSDESVLSRFTHVCRKVEIIMAALDWDTMFHRKSLCPMWMRNKDRRWTTTIYSIRYPTIRRRTIISLRLEYWRRNRSQIVVIRQKFDRREFVRRIIQVNESCWERSEGSIVCSSWEWTARLVEWPDQDERSDLNECQSMCPESIKDPQWHGFQSIGRITDRDGFVVDQQ